MKNRKWDISLDNIFINFLKIDSYLSLNDRFKSYFYKNKDDILRIVSYSRKRDFDYLHTQETNKSKYKYKDK